jgi:hypothetical protein
LQTTEWIWQLPIPILLPNRASPLFSPLIIHQL